MMSTATVLAGPGTDAVFVADIDVELAVDAPLEDPGGGPPDRVDLVEAMVSLSASCTCQKVWAKGGSKKRGTCPRCWSRQHGSGTVALALRTLQATRYDCKGVARKAVQHGCKSTCR